jgi:hypothetical protein
MVAYAVASQDKFYAFTAKDQLSVAAAKEQLSLAAAKEQLSYALAKEQLSTAAASDKLQIYLSQEDIQSAVKGLAIVPYLSNKDVVASELQFVYDKAGLQFVFLKRGPLSSQSVAEAPGLQYAYSVQPLCLFGKENLNVMCDNYNLQKVFLSTTGIAGIIYIIGRLDPGVISPPPG